MGKWEEMSYKIAEIEREISLLRKEIAIQQTLERKNAERKKPTIVSYGAVESKADKEEKTESYIADANPIAMNREETIHVADTIEANVKVYPQNQPSVSLHNQNKRQNEKTSINWEKELGQKWLPRVFLFVLIMGFIWGFIAAVDEGWITPPFRLLIGFLVGGLLYVLGERQLRQNRHNLGISLLAGMVILFTVTTFAMNSLYGYTGFWVTFVCYATWLGIGLWLSARHKSENLAIMVSIGGFFIPMVIREAAGQQEMLFYLYEAILYGIYLYFASSQQFKKLHYVTFIGLHIVTVMYSAVAATNDVYPILMFWMQHFLLMYTFFFRNYMSGSHRVTTLLFSFFLNLKWTLDIWNEAESIYLFSIVTALYIGVALWAWKKEQKEKNRKNSHCDYYCNLLIRCIDADLLP